MTTDDNGAPEVPLEYSLGDVLGEFEERFDEPAMTGEAPAHLIDQLRVGLIGEMADWFDACAIREQRTASTVAAMCTAGALYGRAYESPTGLRTNLYAIAVIQSGGGKESARNCVKNLLSRSGCEQMLGADEIGSGAGLLDQFHEHPIQLMLLDEIGKLIEKIGSSRAGSWEKDISSALLRLHSSANTIMMGKALRGGKTAQYVQPHGVMYGTTTPQIYDGLSGADTASGFLNRILVFPGRADLPPLRDPKGRPHKPPASLVESVRYSQRCAAAHMAEGAGSGNLSGISAPTPYELAWGPGAQEIIASVDSQLRAKADPEGAGAEGGIEMWSRMQEQAQRVALIRALSRDQARPVLTAEDAACGAEIATWCVSRLAHDVSERVSDSAFEAQHKLVLRVIRSHHAYGGTPKRHITRMTPAMDRRARDEAIAYLLECGEIEERAGPRHGGSGRVALHYSPCKSVAH